MSKAKPGDEEAHRAVGNLSVEKTIHKGGYEGAESTKEVRVNKIIADEGDDKRLSPVQQLERAIKKKPDDVEKYIELSDLHQREEDFAAAEGVLTRALAASGGNVQIRERLEDVQLRRARQQLEIADQKAKAEKTEAAETLARDLRRNMVNKEIEVFAARCERYPADLAFKYQLATRLERGKKFAEAIKLLSGSAHRFETSGADPDGAGPLLHANQAIQAGIVALSAGRGSHPRSRGRATQGSALHGRQARRAPQRFGRGREAPGGPGRAGFRVQGCVGMAGQTGQITRRWAAIGRRLAAGKTPAAGNMVGAAHPTIFCHDDLAHAQHQECQETTQAKPRRRTRNRATRSSLKTQIRKVRETVTAGNVEQATTELKLVTKKLDRAAAKGVLHDNAAARIKSRFSAAIKASKQKPPAAKA